MVNRKQFISLFLMVALLGGGLASMGGVSATSGSANVTGTTILTQNGHATQVSYTQNNNGSHYSITNGSTISFTEPYNTSNINVTLGNSPASGSFNVTKNNDMVNVTYNNGGTTATATLDNATFTYNLSNNATKTGVIHTNNLTVPKNLSVGPNNNVQKYRVINRYTNVNYNVTGTSGVSFNKTTKTFNVSNSGHVQMHMTFTRNGTGNYTNYSANSLYVQYKFNNTQFSNINDVTPYSANGVTLANRTVTGSTTTYKWQLQNPNNTTKNWSVYVNATVQSANTNSSVVSSEQHSPQYGPTDTYSTTYSTGGSSGLIGPQTTHGIFGLPWYYWAIGVVAIALLLYGLFSYKTPNKGGSGMMGAFHAYGVGTGWKAIGGLVVALIGVTMILDAILPTTISGINLSVPVLNNFYTNLLSQYVGIQGMTAQAVEILIGAVLIALFVYEDRSEAQELMG